MACKPEEPVMPCDYYGYLANVKTWRAPEELRRVAEVARTFALAVGAPPESEPPQRAARVTTSGRRASRCHGWETLPAGAHCSGVGARAGSKYALLLRNKRETLGLL